MIPCKDCITLGICKAEVIRSYEEKVIKHSRERLTDNVILNLSIKCSLIHDYVGFQKMKGINITTERFVITNGHMPIYKAIKKKMDEVKVFFNLPLGDEYVKTNM